MTHPATRSKIAFRSILAFGYSFFVVVIFAATASTQTPQEVQTIAEQVIRRLDLQTELPREAEKPRITLKLPPEFLWLVVAIGLGVLLYAFRDMIPIVR